MTRSTTWIRYDPRFPEIHRDAGINDLPGPKQEAWDPAALC
jgi:hypothetical protein